MFTCAHYHAFILWLTDGEPRQEIIIAEPHGVPRRRRCCWPAPLSIVQCKWTCERGWLRNEWDISVTCLGITNHEMNAVFTANKVPLMEHCGRLLVTSSWSPHYAHYDFNDDQGPLVDKQVFRFCHWRREVEWYSDSVASRRGEEDADDADEECRDYGLGEDRPHFPSYPSSKRVKFDITRAASARMAWNRWCVTK